MEKFYASLKTLRPVQILVLVFALLASGGATYAGYEYSSRGGNNIGLEEDQQLIPISYGDLVRQVTTQSSAYRVRRYPFQRISRSNGVSKTLLRRGLITPP